MTYFYSIRLNKDFDLYIISIFYWIFVSGLNFPSILKSLAMKNSKEVVIVFQELKSKI